VTVSNGSPPVTVPLPSTNTVAGSQVVVDATTSPGMTKVVFELEGGGPFYPTACDVGDRHPHPCGWVFVWNSPSSNVLLVAASLPVRCNGVRTHSRKMRAATKARRMQCRAFVQSVSGQRRGRNPLGDISVRTIPLEIGTSVQRPYHRRYGGRLQ
jgi:hypothetical protein